MPFPAACSAAAIAKRAEAGPSKTRAIRTPTVAPSAIRLQRPANLIVAIVTSDRRCRQLP
jgi:hypothetical protein